MLTVGQLTDCALLSAKFEVRSFTLSWDNIIIIIMSRAPTGAPTPDTGHISDFIFCKTLRDSRKLLQQMVKKHGKTFVKIAKITAKTRHQITGPKTIIQSIELNI